MGTGARSRTIQRPVTQHVCCPLVYTEGAFRPLSQRLFNAGVRRWTLSALKLSSGVGFSIYVLICKESYANTANLRR